MSLLFPNVRPSPGPALKLLFICLFLGSCFYGSQAWGSGLKLRPSVTLDLEYNDNIFFAKKDTEKAFITTLSPNLIIEETTERMKTGCDILFDAIRYSGFNELNTTDISFKAFMDHSATEKIHLKADLAAIKDSRADREIDETGLILTGDREKQNVSFFGELLLSEKTKAAFSVSYGNEDIDGETKEENSTAMVELTLSTNLSELMENTAGLINLKYTDYESWGMNSLNSSQKAGAFNHDTQYHIWQLTTGISKSMTRQLSFNAQAGTSFVRSKESVQSINDPPVTDLFSSGTKHDRNHTWGAVFSGGLTYQGLYSELDLSTSHGITPAGGSSGTTERSSLMIDYTKKLTENFKTSISGACHLNRDDNKNSPDIDEVTLKVGSSLSYFINRDLGFSLAWIYISVEDRQESTTKNRNLIYGRFVKRFELSF